MRRAVCLSTLFFLVFFFIIDISWANYNITQLTDNTYKDSSPQTNSRGDVVWSGYDGSDNEIFLYVAPSGITTKITNNSYDDLSPQINDKGDVVWSGRKDGSDNEIFLYEASTGITTQITNNSYDDIVPQINNNKEIVWLGKDGTNYDVFLYEGTPVPTKITNSNNKVNSYSSSRSGPQINSRGDIVWHGFTGTRTEIFLYEASTSVTRQVSNNPYYSCNAQINSNGDIVWLGKDESYNYAIFLYSAEGKPFSTERIAKIANNPYNQSKPQINSNSDVVWRGYDEFGKTLISLYNVSTKAIKKIHDTDNYSEEDPQINDRGDVVWSEYDSPFSPRDYEIYLYEASTGITTQLTNNGGNTIWNGDDYHDRYPQINDKGDVVWSGYDGSDYEIFIAISDSEQCPNGDSTDKDGDGLLDCWETNGIVDWDGDGILDFKLFDMNKNGEIEDSERPDPDKKDIYIEVDWMAQHYPGDPKIEGTALNKVIKSFAAQDIRLHIQVDEEAMAHHNDFAFEPCTAPAVGDVDDFDNIKSTHFGTQKERNNSNSTNILNAKRLVFHYALIVHNLLGHDNSGCAELAANDFVVSLGRWKNSHKMDDLNKEYSAAVNNLARTFMHELGHNLNLRHGGVDGVNCKPNYLSVMSYCRQSDLIEDEDQLLNYSEAALDTLFENNLSEQAGINGPDEGYKTACGPPPPNVVPANQAIDWNRDGDDTDEGVSCDINKLGRDGCDGYGSKLKGYNDWANLQYNFRNTGDFADGIHLSVLNVEEITFNEAVGMSPDSDGDGVVKLLDNCPDLANPDQADCDGDGVGDACDNCPNISNPDQTDNNNNGIGDVCELIPGDLDGDGGVDLDDVNIIKAHFNQPASACPKCDLDGDGKITALDSRKLVLLCTCLRCVCP